MKKTMIKFISGVAALALALVSFQGVSASTSASPLQATSAYYVSPTGNDANLCTSTAPCKTFTRAMNLAAVGDTIIIAAGNYPQQVTISKPLTLKAAGIVKTLGFIIRADNVTIDGFDITSPKTSSGFGVRVYNANCKILNNYIHDTWWDGILLEGTSSNCLVSGNKIERASQSGAEVRGNNHTIQFNEVLDTLQTPPGSTFTRSQGADADGFRFFGGGHQFIGNYIHDIKGGTSTNPDPHTDCFQSWKDSAPRLQAHDILFKNNKCFLSWDNNQASSSKVFQFGNVINSIVEGNISRTRMASIVQDGSHDITFINNTFIGDGSLSWGIEINTSTYNFTVRDNIFYHQENGYGYLIVKSGVTGVDAGHNCVDATTRTPAGSPRPGDVWGLDPLFVNYLADDFQLQPNSPCAGIGAYISSSPTAMPSPTPKGTSTSIPVTITSSPIPTTILATPTSVTLPTTTLTTAPTTKPTNVPTNAPGVQTLILQPNGSAGIDAYMLNTSAKSNYGKSTDMGVGENNDAANKYAHGLIKFDLSSLPANATIVSATLSLWTSGDLSNTNRTIQVYRLKTPFVEGQVTWKRSATGVNWQVAGATGAKDKESAAIGSVLILANESLNTEKQIGLDPAKIQELVNGTYANNGFILIANTELDDRFNYKTSDTSNAGQRPKLVIQYVVGEQLNALSNIPDATVTTAPTIVPTISTTPVPTETVVLPTETPVPTQASVTPVEVTYDNTDAGFAYSPEWTNNTDSAAYSGSFNQTTENGATATFNFSGTSFSVLYTGGPAFRSMDVYVDDVLVGSINQKADAHTYQLRWDYTGQLEPGSHVLKLVFITDNTSGDTKGSLDAVIVR